LTREALKQGRQFNFMILELARSSKLDDSVGHALKEPVGSFYTKDGPWRDGLLPMSVSGPVRSSASAELARLTENGPAVQKRPTADGVKFKLRLLIRQ